MNTAIKQLENFPDIGTLKPAIHSLCSRYGSVARLDILAASQAGKRQALCFVRMDSAEEERQLMSDLGVGRFAGDLVMIVDLHTPGTVRLGSAGLQQA
ncbi:MAG: hypothetical protein Q8M91_09860 [Polaromonas sp.]|nr:hypothetical protein [Polaromonas sp.]MDP3310401.1 hypothetical protein [Polaromonas sp.]MDP3605111.1 hypothetical protein [Polaromonas sp.]